MGRLETTSVTTKTHEGEIDDDKGYMLCAYANDVVIIARSRQRLIEVYKEVNKKSAGMGFNINISKTKCTSPNRKEN